MEEEKKPRDEKEEKKLKYQQASADLLSGKFHSIREAATKYGISYSTLWAGMIKRGGEFSGSGRFSTRLSPAEEKKIVDHVKYRASIGYGVDWQMLTLLLQEIFLAVKKSDPDRMTGLEECGQLPNPIWVRRFAERHQLVPRATMGISKGRQVVTAEEIALWQEDAYSFFSKNPDLLEALQVAVLFPEPGLGFVAFLGAVLQSEKKNLAS